MRLPSLLFCALLGLLLSGCAGDDWLNTDSYPGDFSLHVLVRGEADADEPAIREDARYLLQPGGVLRGVTGKRARGEWYPPPVRRLSPRQVQEVYEQTAQAIRPLEPVEIPRHALMRRAPTGPIRLVLTAGGETKAYGGEPTAHPDLLTLVRTLTDLGTRNPSPPEAATELSTAP